MTFYKFANPLSEDEAAERFELVEDRGDRVLVRSVVHCVEWALRPTFVCVKSELQAVEAAE